MSEQPVSRLPDATSRRCCAPRDAAPGKGTHPRSVAAAAILAQSFPSLAPE